MNIKKIIILTVLILALPSLAACGEKNSESAPIAASDNESYVIITDSDEESKAESAADSDINSNKSSSASDSESNSVNSEKKTAASKAASSVTSPKAEAVSSAAESSSASSEAPDEFETDPDSEYTVSAEEVESSLSGYENEISGEWKATYILDSSSQEVSGEELFGKAYRQYGGTLTFNEDGTFSLRLGVNADDETTEGTYTYLGGSDIQLQYSDDRLETCKRVYVNDTEAVALPIDLFGDVFTVYFTL